MISALLAACSLASCNSLEVKKAVTPLGRILESTETGARPYSLAVSPSEAVWIVESGPIGQNAFFFFTLVKGSEKTVLKIAKDPSDGETGPFALGEDGTAWVLIKPSSMLHLSKEGDVLARTEFPRTNAAIASVKDAVWAAAALTSTATASGPSGVFTVASGSNAIRKLASDGSIVVSSDVSRPISIALDPDGNPWVSTQEGRVLRFSPELKPLNDLKIGTGPLVLAAGKTAMWVLGTDEALLRKLSY